MLFKKNKKENPFSIALKNIKINPFIKVLRDKRLKLNPTQFSYEQLAKECHDIWAEIVKRECGYKCQWKPFAINENLPGNRECEGAKSAHHLLSAQTFNLRYNPVNGICVCRKHHLYTIHKNNVWVHYWLPTIRSKSVLKKMYEKSKEPNSKHTKFQLIGIYYRLQTQLNRVKK